MQTIQPIPGILPTPPTLTTTRITPILAPICPPATTATQPHPSRPIKTRPEPLKIIPARSNPVFWAPTAVSVPPRRPSITLSIRSANGECEKLAFPTPPAHSPGHLTIGLQATQSLFRPPSLRRTLEPTKPRNGRRGRCKTTMPRAYRPVKQPKTWSWARAVRVQPSSPA